jgi:hypothetical protein
MVTAEEVKQRAEEIDTKVNTLLAQVEDNT